MTEPEITPELIERHGVTREEYAKIKALLDREPNLTELGIFSVMWSEHCSYKHTRRLLKQLPARGSTVLVGAGEENAGVLDIGDGLAVAFKLESHNHPSAVEPFQGAATGVGGIIRDIFTMGARPVCLANSLRFGGLDSAEARRLFRGVVAGIAHYGNCVGIPTVAGEAYYDPCYEGNPLVNVFCLGVLRHDQIARGAAHGVGNPVFYLGPSTGRDGLAGAAFASQDLTGESARQQRGAVQVGDPFMEKLLVEACLELLATGAVAGIQDMGAAGLTCSCCETAARAGTGIEVELDRVPQRSRDMTPYEIMLSESQERMLVIVRKGRESQVKHTFEKWDLPWAKIGRVTDSGRMVIKHHGAVVADIPAAFLTGEAPVHDRESRRPEHQDALQRLDLDSLPDTRDPVGDLRRILAWPSIASKGWIYQQYDFTVRNGTAVFPGSDAAVIRVKADSIPQGARPPGCPEKYLAISLDCNAVHVVLDPYEGAKSAVVEAARNLACSGASPLGVTDNLNFGNPHQSECLWQLKEAIRGLAEGCRGLNLPVTGGNVSLYNQNPHGAIDPTPVVGMVGLISDPRHITTPWFKDEGDAIVLLGDLGDPEDPLCGLGGSAYLQVIHGRKIGAPPVCRIEREKALQDALRGWIAQGVIKSAHDCSEGGFAVAVCEGCISGRVGRGCVRLRGAFLDLSWARPGRLDALLFGETQGRILISLEEPFVAKVVGQAGILGIPARRVGRVEGGRLRIKTAKEEWEWDVRLLHQDWSESIPARMSW